MENLDKLTKEELIATIKKMQASKDGGRKKEVLDLLISVGKKGIKIKDIAEQIGISERNVSSQLSYLRKDGHSIGSKSNGNKYIEEDED